MKRLLIFVSIVSSCVESEPIENVSGNWIIEWATATETRTGQLELRSDHSGLITTLAEPNSLLISSAEHVKIRWIKTNNQLIFERIDNQFELVYTIVESKEHTILLKFADDIDVRLIRN